MKTKTKRTSVKQYCGNLGIVQLLLKEVLEQLSEELAKEMVDAIKGGGEAALIMRENSRGRGYVISFTVVPVPGTIASFNLAGGGKLNPKSFVVHDGGQA